MASNLADVARAAVRPPLDLSTAEAANKWEAEQQTLHIAAHRSPSASVDRTKGVQSPPASRPAPAVAAPPSAVPTFDAGASLAATVDRMAAEMLGQTKGAAPLSPAAGLSSTDSATRLSAMVDREIASGRHRPAG